MKLRTLMVVGALVALGVMTGCASGPAKGGEIIGRWQPTKIEGSARAVPGTYIEFAGDGRTTGFSGVNTFAGPYTAESGGALKVGPLASTMMAGPPAAMTGEQAFLGVLEKASGYTVADGTLTMYDQAGAVVAEFEPAKKVGLTDTEWVLTGHNNGKGALVTTAESGQITAEFDEKGRVSGTTGCGTYTATYTAEASTIGIGKPEAKKTEPCPIGLSSQRAEYLAALPKAATYVISVAPSAGGAESTLELRDATGVMLATYRGANP